MTTEIRFFALKSKKKEKVLDRGGLADSYAYEKLIRKWTKSVCFFGTKNMSEGDLMHTVLVCYVFDKLGQACLCG